MDGAAGFSGFSVKYCCIYQALESAKLPKGARVLVHAGAGGVGTFAVQLAKVHFGAYVVATSGPKNTAFLKEEASALSPVLAACCSHTGSLF